EFPGVLPERSGVDAAERLEVGGVRRADLEPGDARRGREIFADQAHQPHAEEMLSGAPLDADGHADAPRDLELVVKVLRALEVCVSRGDIAVVPLWVRQAGGHAPDAS